MFAFSCGFLLLSLDVLLLWAFFRRVWQLQTAYSSKMLVVLIFSKMAVLGSGVYFSLVIWQQSILYFTLGALLALCLVVVLCIAADKHLYSRRVLR